MLGWFFVRQRRKVTCIRDVLQFSIRKKIDQSRGFPVISIARRVLRLGLIGLLVCPVAYADVPAALNYQGTLTDGAGQPINGDKTITLRLYTVPSGGTPFWVGKQTLAVKDGRFSVVLGGAPSNPLDPKLFTGETYIGTQVAPDAEMPRQKLASVAYAFKAADAIPKGVIVMWSGGADAIPAGWALCDGGNGTPDLRDKFVMGGGGSLPVSGGSVSHAHGLPEHNHTIAADGSHAHHIDVNFYNCIGDCDDMAEDGRSKMVGSEGHGHHLIADTWEAGTHSHGGQTGNGGSGTSSNSDHLPPYYALAFIMKL